MVPVGAAAPTLTVTKDTSTPDGAPGPWQFKVYVCEVIRLPVDCPVELDVPVQPPGLTLQLVALFDDQVIFAEVL